MPHSLFDIIVPKKTRSKLKVSIPEPLEAYPDFKFEVNESERRISLGDKITLKRPIFYKSPQEVLGFVKQDYSPEGVLVPRAVTFNRELGITAKNFIRVANKLTFNLWIEPVQEYVNLLAMTVGGKILPCQVEKIWRLKDKLDQCKADGQDNLLPIVFATGQSPKELKEFYGKGVWKKICSNTKTRNRLLARAKEHTNLAGKERLVFLNGLPSKVLKAGGIGFNAITEATPWILKVSPKIFSQHARLNKRISSLGMGRMLRADAMFADKLQEENDLLVQVRPIRERISRLHHLFSDTKRMARQLGSPFNPEWSEAKMNQKHEEYRLGLEVRQAKLKSMQIEIEAPFDNLSLDGYTAYRLKTTGSVREEGYEQNHCVGSYAQSCSDGSYVVFSIRDSEGKRYSTLGFRKNKISGLIEFNQHYMKNNRPVDQQGTINLAREVEALWNYSIREKIRATTKGNLNDKHH